MEPHLLTAPAAENLTVPLISKKPVNKIRNDEDLESSSYSDSDSDSDLDLDPNHSTSTNQPAITYVPVIQNVTTALIVVGGLSASAIVMLSTPAISAFVAGGVCMIISLFVGSTQCKIARHGGIHQIQHCLEQARHRQKLLQEKVSTKEAIVDNLQEDVECLEDVEMELAEIAHGVGSDSDEIVMLVKESEYILEQMKKYLRQVTMAEITRIVMAFDRNAEMTIDLEDLDELARRVTSALEKRGIELDGDKFKAVIRGDNKISRVLKVIGALMFGEIIEEEQMLATMQERTGSNSVGRTNQL